MNELTIEETVKYESAKQELDSIREPTFYFANILQGNCFPGPSFLTCANESYNFVINP